MDAMNIPPWLLQRDCDVNTRSLVFRGMLAVVLIVGTFCIAATNYDGSGADSWMSIVMHHINTPIHEAGHAMTRSFPRLFASLAGTLAQLALPLICAMALLFIGESRNRYGHIIKKTRDPFGASVALWWHFENWIDCAPYIADASRGVLPLIGGGTGQNTYYGFHDWRFILTELNLLAHDQSFARAAFTLGLVGMTASLVWGVIVLWHERQAMLSERARGGFV